MARAAADSDSESDRGGTHSKTSASATKSSKNKEPVMDVDEDDDGSEGVEEEYEIEKILDAKLGTFPNGRMGYLVKWKGYSEEHNSWVDEKDAGNAQVLIDEYWQRNKKDKKAGRKSMGPAPRVSSAKAPRGSTARDDSSEVEEMPAKKRGRPPKAKSARGSSEQQKVEDEEEEDRPKVKKARKSTGKKAASEPMDVDESGPESYRDMKTWMSSATWEHIVDTIDTVERTSDDRLLVYFTLKNGKGRAREETAVCKEKMPRKLLEFYEQNLRWRASDEND